jgi:predicted TIM-barrel fold metal-dependent hydrolase
LETGDVRIVNNSEPGQRDFARGSAPASRAASALETTPLQRPAKIDCQSHLFCEEVVTRMEGRKTDPIVYTRENQRFVRMGDWHRKILPHHMDVEAKLRVMDENGIALTALSINDPGPEWFEEDGPAVARVLNDFVAGIVRAHPRRFFGLCVLPLRQMPAALAELDRCVGDLGMKGILLYTNLAGRFPDEAEFRPLFARAARHDLPILLHPAKPVTIDLVKEYEMTSTLGNMFDNTIALTRILMAGILDEFPDLKLVCPHLGGTLPYIVGRLDHQVAVLKRGPRNLRRLPSESLRQVYFDIVSPLPGAMRFAYDFSGPDKLLFASDHPWVDPGLIARTLESLKLPSEDEARIFAGNARKLFRL